MFLQFLNKLLYTPYLHDDKLRMNIIISGFILHKFLKILSTEVPASADREEVKEKIETKGWHSNYETKKQKDVEEQGKD